MASATKQPKQPRSECWHDYINNEHAVGSGMRIGRPKGNELWLTEDFEWDTADLYEAEYGLVKVAKTIIGVKPGEPCRVCGKVPFRCGHVADEHPDDGLPPESPMCRAALGIALEQPRGGA